MLFDVKTSFKNYLKILIRNNLTNIKFLVSCCRVSGVFQAPQAACGRSIMHHSLPEDTFKIPTCSVVISPNRSVPSALSGKQKHSKGQSTQSFNTFTTARRELASNGHPTQTTARRELASSVHFFFLNSA